MEWKTFHPSTFNFFQILFYFFIFYIKSQGWKGTHILTRVYIALESQGNAGAAAIRYAVAAEEPESHQARHDKKLVDIGLGNAGLPKSKPFEVCA